MKTVIPWHYFVKLKPWNLFFMLRSDTVWTNPITVTINPFIGIKNRSSDLMEKNKRLATVPGWNRGKLIIQFERRYSIFFAFINQYCTKKSFKKVLNLFKRELVFGNWLKCHLGRGNQILADFYDRFCIFP